MILLKQWFRFTTFAIVAILTCAYGCSRQHQEQVKKTEVYRIGAAIPLTGPGAALGTLIKRGLELGVADANAKRPAKPIEIVFEDTKTDPKEGLTVFRKLISSGKIRVVLVGFSAVCNSVAPLAEESKVLMVGMTTSMPGLTQGRNYVVRLFPNAEMLAGTIADYAKIHYRRAAVMYANDEYGKNTFATFKERFQGDGREVAFDEAFSPTEKEFRTTVSKMLAAKPDVVYLPGYGAGYIALIKQIRELNPTIPIMGDSPLTNPPVYMAAGNAVDGVVVPATALDAGEAGTAQQKAFLDKYQRDFSENPSINVTINYDFVQLMSHAITETDGTPEAIHAFLLRQRPYHGLVGEIEYQKDGESIVKVHAMKIEGGRILPLAK